MENKQSIGESIGQFSFDLLKQLSNKQNLIFSPLSIYASLALAAYGSNDNTLKEFQSLMRFETKSQLAESLNTIQKIFKEDSDNMNITMKNKLLVGLKSISEQYSRDAEKYFDTSVETVDFSQDADRIVSQTNSWVSNATNGKINGILNQGSISPLTRILILNAIYFNGKWQKQFKKEDTIKQPFFIEKTKKKNVLMMNARNSYSYLETDEYQFISLPYKNSDYSMLIFLPSKSTLLDFLKIFSYSELINAFTNSSSTKVQLTLPKFKINGENSTSLNEILKGLGLSECFTDQANFKDIEKQNQLKIDDILHKALIEVDEAGTEAAAATAVTMRKKCKKLPSNVVMVCNKPFVYALYHQATSTILFMGNVLNPAQD